MQLKFLGTAAAEGWPAIFCQCEACKTARQRGGRNIRTRSQSIVDRKLLIDMPADTYMHVLQNNLDFSKVESGKYTIEEREYEMSSLLYDLTTIAAVRLGKKPVDFMVEAEGSVPALLVGDMVRVKQILVNIIGNAVKFTQEGYVRLSVQAEEEKEGIRLTMKVEDTGVGIKKQDIGKLFVSFNQVDTHYSPVPSRPWL